MTTPFFRTFMEIFNKFPSIDGLILDDEESLTFKIEGLGRITIGWMEETDNYVFRFGGKNVSIYHEAHNSAHPVFDINEDGDVFIRDRSHWVRLRMSTGEALSGISDGDAQRGFLPLLTLSGIIISTHKKIAGDIIKWASYV